MITTSFLSPRMVMMIRERRPAVPEDDVIRMWLQRAKPDIEFEARCGRRVRVIDAGARNRHDGPDFLDAAITVDGALRRGDIEVHTHPEDWRRHGHGGDPRYATVVLHVCLYDGTLSVPFPTIVLSRNLGRPFRDAWRAARNGRHALACMRPQRLPASDDALQRPGGGRPVPAHTRQAPIHAMTVLTAARRFERKKQRMAIRCDALARELGEAAAFRQLVYELCARAAGYGGNERQFETLARALPLRDVATLRSALRIARITAAQFAGSWNSSAVMPHNRAGRRLAWFAAWCEQLDDPDWWRTLLALVREGRREAEAYAPLFRVPDRRDNPGPERIAEFMINVLAPALRHFAERRGDGVLARAAMKLYVASAPAPQNRHTRILSRSFEFACVDGERQQGMIELATEFCEKERCAQCLLRPA